MSVKVSNLLALININPDQLKMEWTIATPHLNVNDFISYVAPKTIAVKKSSRKNRLIKATENIDKLLRDGIAEINIAAGKMTYKKFDASDVAASILMVENRIMLNDVQLNHAGGSISLKGSLVNGQHTNQMSLESKIKNVNIPGIFYAFDNFGQDAITHKNMKGQLSATITVSGGLTDKATVIENSMRGKVEFSVANGELINFEPAMKIATTAFKNRDFSNIKFAELTNHMALNGSAFTFERMEIRSNVVILFVEGVYDTKHGTDMSIQVPLSNLSREENDIAKNTGRAGVNIRLRAKTGEDGKLNISWDPFNSAAKKRKEEK